MKVTLEFNLPDERCEYETAHKATDLYLVLWHLQEFLVKEYNDVPHSAGEEAVVQRVLGKMQELMDEYRVDLEAL